MSAATDAPFERLLPLAGGFNLRDLGGWPTADGGRVKTGMLYRSGMMAKLTGEDEAHLRGLGIATVCDFRRRDERTSWPTRWAEQSDTTILTRDYTESSGVLDAVLRGSDSSVEAMRDAMIGIYRTIPDDHAPSYRVMFERLLAGHVPLLFNCMAGKDRTGVAAVLILHTLGVAHETIVEDYLLTDRYTNFAMFFDGQNNGLARLWRNRPEIVKPVLTVEAAYLDSLFVGLDERHGGIDAYLQDVLAVGEAERAELRALLVEPPAA